MPVFAYRALIFKALNQNSAVGLDAIICACVCLVAYFQLCCHRVGCEGFFGVFPSEDSLRHVM